MKVSQLTLASLWQIIKQMMQAVFQVGCALYLHLPPRSIYLLIQTYAAVKPTAYY